MDPQLLLAGAVAGAGMGVACGIIPLNAGRAVRREGAGAAALAACVLTGALLGCLGALPLALFLASVIRGMGESVDYGRSPWERRRSSGLDRYGHWRPKARYTARGRTITCNRCRQVSDRLPDGSIPAECPDCRLVFRDVPTVGPADRNRPAYPPAVEVIDLEAAEPGRPVADRRSVN